MFEGTGGGGGIKAILLGMHGLIPFLFSAKMLLFIVFQLKSFEYYLLSETSCLLLPKNNFFCEVFTKP